jgi:hypothetical protein
MARASLSSRPSQKPRPVEGARYCAGVAPRRKGGRVPGTGAGRRFTKAELGALSVPDDIVLKLTDDLAADIPEGNRGRQSDLPHWAGAGPEDGAAIAVWQMLSSGDRRGGKIPSWLHKQGINNFRGWVRHAALGPDFVMDWVILSIDGTYETARDGDAGPYSPPPGCDLQTFVDAVARCSRELLHERLGRWRRASSWMPGEGDDAPLDPLDG